MDVVFELLGCVKHPERISQQLAPNEHQVCETQEVF
jgi:hypothetical protein